MDLHRFNPFAQKWAKTTEEVEILRAPEWSEIREAHIKKHPRCAFCGSTKYLDVHHIKPVSTHPELELDPRNLVTLCSESTRFKGLNCHLAIGHAFFCQRINPNVLRDIRYLRKLLKQDRSLFPPGYFKKF